MKIRAASKGIRLALLSTAALTCGWTAEAHERPASAPEPGLIQKAEHAVQHGVGAAASGIERGVKATARGVQAAASGIERGASAAARGIEKGAQATTRAADAAASRVGIDRPASPASAPSTTPR